MTTAEKTMIRSLDKKLSKIDMESFKRPGQGWIRTIREALGITSKQMARRMGMSQPRITQMEKNENNLKISTLERAAAALGCTLVYAFVPQEPIERMLHQQARQMAEKLISKVNVNMALENQQVNSQIMIEDMTKDILDGSLSKIWED
jgi:predicted DNA-binding mobile mystery protein A